MREKESHNAQAGPEISKAFFTEAAAEDPGADTQRRFVYQNTVAAYIALLMYTGQLDFKEILCEHHEDIIGVTHHNKLHGIQVKTRNDGIPFTRSSKPVRDSIARFIRLNEEFPGLFERFEIISNCGFNMKDPPKPEDLAELTHCDTNIIEDTLKKTAYQPMPEFDDIKPKMIEAALSHIEPCKSMNYEQLKAITEKLIAAVHAASALDRPHADYIHLTAGDAQQNLAMADIGMKRITPERVGAIIQSVAEEYKRKTDSDDLFIGLLSIECRIEKSVTVDELQETGDRLSRILGIERRFNAPNALERLKSSNYLLETHNQNIFALNSEGKKQLKRDMEKQWSVYENRVRSLPIDEKETNALLCKYFVENMPKEERIKRLKRIVQFLQKYYRDICWSTEILGQRAVVPFHVIEPFDKGQKITCSITKETSPDKIEYDHKYRDWYNERNRIYDSIFKDTKEVKNGSVYRLIDLNSTEKEVCFCIGTDQGYIDFQSTCGKIRNEIDHSIVNFKGRVQDFADQLDFRKKTLHTTHDIDDITRYFKKRVVKTGIEVCTIIVDTDEQNGLCNPRIPIVFRDTRVAEYPGFSMVVPSGAWQAALLQDHEAEAGYSEQLAKRLDWQTSVIRELGEELFNIKHLEKYHIPDLMESEQFAVCKEILEEAAVYFGVTGYGIDMYLGSGGLLVTLILDHQKVLSVLNKRNTELCNEARQRFMDITTEKAECITEGRLYTFCLDDVFIENVIAYYVDKSQAKPLKPINYPTKKEFPPMIPSGVISILLAKKKYEALRMEKIRQGQQEKFHGM